MHGGRRIDTSNRGRYMTSSSNILSIIPLTFIKLPINNQNTDQNDFITYEYPKENRKSEGYSKIFGNYSFANCVGMYLQGSLSCITVCWLLLACL